MTIRGEREWADVGRWVDPGDDDESHQPTFIESNHKLLVAAVFTAFGAVCGALQSSSGLFIAVVVIGAVLILSIVAALIWINERANDPNPSRKEAQRAVAASEALRLARDCDEQDSALLRGDWAFGTYGRFPVPSVLEALPTDIDELAMAAVTGLIIGTITGTRPDRSWIEFDKR